MKCEWHMLIYWHNNDMMSKLHWTLYKKHIVASAWNALCSTPGLPTSSLQPLSTGPLGRGVWRLGLRGLFLCASGASSAYLYFALISRDWHFLLSLSSHPSRLSYSSLVPCASQGSWNTNSHQCMFVEWISEACLDFWDMWVSKKEIGRLLEGQWD